jgi:tetratricopeptide (TPR) repeat protein
VKHDEPTEAEGEVAVARLLMADGDLKHALRHLADAFARDPRLPDTHEALAEFVARAGGPDHALTYFDENEGFIGTVCARAHVCAAAGQWDEAVTLLFMVAAHEPRRPWLDVAWLQQPDLPVSPDEFAIALVKLAQRLDDPVDEDERAPLLPALALTRAAVARNGDHPTLLWSASALARRLGAFGESVDWADRSFQIEPSHSAAVMKGYALRTMGRPKQALTVWQAEIDREPDDLALYVDVADLYAALDEYTEALAWAERAVARDPGHDRAVPTAHGLRYLIDGDVRHLVTLADHVREEPGGYAAAVLARVCAGRPWLSVVPDAHEALINVLRQVLDTNEPNPEMAMTLTLSALEPPSAFLTLHAVFPKTSVEVQSVPEPDMRLPARPVTDAVWRYDGAEVEPVLPPPPDEVAAAVRDVATHGWWSPLEAYDRAVALSACDPAHLMSVLTHPPAPPDDETGQLLGRHAPHLWVRAAQVWACLGIAHHRSDEPWTESRRRAILADLVNGPEDWVTEAAAFAVVVTAWVDPDARADAYDLVVRRMLDLVHARQEREVTILSSMCLLVLMLPGAPDEVTALARDVLSSLAPEE